MYAKSLLIVAAVATSLLGGCAGSPRLESNPANQVQIVDQLAPPRPDEAARLAAAREFVIGPFDEVAVRVIGFDGLDSRVQVDSGGRIQLPLIGSVLAAGKTPATLSNELTSAYEQTYLRRPNVTVSIVEIKSLYITVEGAVRRPGVFPAVGPLRLQGAVALAEGTNDFAAFDNVAVFRIIDGKQYAAIFSLRDIRSGLYEDPEIYPNDTVIVGESQVRRLFRDFIQTAPFIAAFRPFG